MQDISEHYKKRLDDLARSIASDNDVDDPGNVTVVRGDFDVVHDWESSGIQLRIGSHTYASGTLDALHLFAPSQELAGFGFLLLQAVLSESRRAVTAHLRDSSSHVKRIIVELQPNEELVDDASLAYSYVGLLSRAVAFVYRPAVLNFAPLSSAVAGLGELPVLRLHREDDDVFYLRAGEEQRDCVTISGNDVAIAKLAEVFLNASQLWQPLSEWSLESAIGAGGVGRDSAELRIYAVS